MLLIIVSLFFCSIGNLQLNAKEVVNDALNSGSSNVATPFEYTQKIKDRLEEIRDISVLDYSTRIDGYRTELEQYFEHTKRVCNGEFSTIILSDQKSLTSSGSRKLAPEEKKLCFREMKALQLTFINNMFIARKRYLDHLHSERIAELERIKNQATSDLQKRFYDQAIDGAIKNKK